MSLQFYRKLPHMIILGTVPFETPEMCFVGPRYLNDVGTGGHTLFPTLGIKVKPSKGSASLGLAEKKPVIPKLPWEAGNVFVCVFLPQYELKSLKNHKNPQNQWLVLMFIDLGFSEATFQQAPWWKCKMSVLALQILLFVRFWFHPLPWFQSIGRVKKNTPP